MSISQQYDSLICDLGDVFLFWSAETATSITPTELTNMMKSNIWHDYECGLFHEEVCYQKLSTTFNCELEDVRRAFRQARESIHPDYECVSLVRQIKETSQGRLRVFAMTNMSAAELGFIREELNSWGIFEDIFASCEMGARKPGSEFYQRVLDAARVSPQRAVFIDDKLNNVQTARSFGMHGIVFDDLTRVRSELLGLLSGDPASHPSYGVDERQVHCSHPRLLRLTDVIKGPNAHRRLVEDLWLGLLASLFHPPNYLGITTR